MWGIGILVLILLPAEIWFFRYASRPAPPPVPRDSVLIADFDNHTGDARFDRSLHTALTVGLEQARRFTVFRGGRFQAALERMKKSPTTKVDEPTGREICRRENVTGLVTCSVARAGQEYSLAARLIDPSSGNTIRSYYEQTSNQDGVLDALGRITASLRHDLAGMLASIHPSGEPLPLVTTPSLQALELYAQGEQMWRHGAYQEAAGSYEAALNLDPDFAMAQAALGGAYMSPNLRDTALAQQHYERALQLAGQVTERERLCIRAGYLADLGRTGEAIDAYKLYLSAYPDDSDTRVGFATVLLRAGRFEEAAGQFQEVLRLAPANAGANAGLAQSCAQLGRYPEALEAYAKAFQAEPQWMTSGDLNHDYGFALAANGNPAAAREVFKKALANPDTASGALRSLALLEMYQGKYRAAQNQLSGAMAGSVGRNETPRSSATSHLYMAILLEEQGKAAEAAAELDRAAHDLKTEDDSELAARIGALYARTGAIEKADRLLQSIRAGAGTGDPERSHFVHLLEGEIALARGNYGAAVLALLAANREEETPETLARLALACEKSGDSGQAAAAYERLAAMEPRAIGGEAQQDWQEAQARLAALYAARGDHAEAAKALAPLARAWKDADRDLPLAKTVARLESALSAQP